MTQRLHPTYSSVAIVLIVTLWPSLCWTEEPVTIHADQSYATVEGQDLKLDLYIPATVSRPPLVIWIHGGGWRAGSRKNPRLRELTKNGFALASISYRLTDKAIFPAQIHDCKAAVRWLRANAARYGYSTDSITVAGSSAGGHLALLLGVTGGVKELEGTVGGNLNQSSTVQAVIDYFGPSDFVLRGKTQPERAYTDKSGSFALLGGSHGKIPRQAEAFASPSRYVTPDDPPLLIFHGDEDKVVLLDQSERMVSSYKKHELSVRLVVLKKAGHGGKPFFDEERLKIVRDFMDHQRRSPKQ